MIKQRLRLLDTEAIAYHYGVAPSSIRRWAHEDRWHPYGTRRERKWSLDAAQVSWEKRHAEDRETCVPTPPNVSSATIRLLSVEDTPAPAVDRSESEASSL